MHVCTSHPACCTGIACSTRSVRRLYVLSSWRVQARSDTDKAGRRPSLISAMAPMTVRGAAPRWIANGFASECFRHRQRACRKTERIFLLTVVNVDFCGFYMFAIQTPASYSQSQSPASHSRLQLQLQPAPASANPAVHPRAEHPVQCVCVCVCASVCVCVCFWCSCMALLWHSSSATGHSLLEHCLRHFDTEETSALYTHVAYTSRTRTFGAPCVPPAQLHVSPQCGPLAPPPTRTRTPRGGGIFSVWGDLNLVLPVGNDQAPSPVLQERIDFPSGRGSPPPSSVPCLCRLSPFRAPHTRAMSQAHEPCARGR